MANYNLVIDSTFKPFSFEEYIKPYQLYGEAYKEQEAIYDALNLASASLRDRIGENDKESLALYNKFMADLDEAATTLSTRGLSPGVRRTLKGLQSRYASDIMSTDAAIKRRDADVLRLYEQGLKDNTFIADGSPADISLDEYRKNPNAGMKIHSYSGALLAKQVSDITSILGKQLRDYSVQGHLDPYTLKVLAQYGLGEAEVMAYINDPTPQKSATLNAIVERVLASAGVNSWNSEEAKAKARDYAVQGVSPAMGMITPSTMAAARASRASSGGGSGNGARRQHYSLQAMPLRNQRQMGERYRELQIVMNKGWIKKEADGQYTLTNSGLAELRKKQRREKGIRHGFTGEERPSAFHQLMSQIMGTDKFLTEDGKFAKGYGPHVLGNAFAVDMRRNEAGSYDTEHSTEYNRSLSHDYGQIFTNDLWASAPSKGLEQVEYEGRQEGFKKVGNLTKSDLDGYVATNVRYSRHGDTAILQKAGADPIRVRVPKQMSLYSSSNVQEAIRQADAWGEVTDKGYLPEMDAQGNFIRDNSGRIRFTNQRLSPEEIQYSRESQRDYLDDVGAYGSQYSIPSNTEEEKYPVLP